MTYVNKSININLEIKDYYEILIDKIENLFEKSFGFIVARRSAAVGALGVD